MHKIVRINNETEEREGEHAICDMIPLDVIKLAARWALIREQSYEVHIGCDTDTKKVYKVSPDLVAISLYCFNKDINEASE